MLKKNKWQDIFFTMCNVCGDMLENKVFELRNI